MDTLFFFALGSLFLATLYYFWKIEYPELKPEKGVYTPYPVKKGRDLLIFSEGVFEVRGVEKAKDGKVRYRLNMGNISRTYEFDREDIVEVHSATIGFDRNIKVDRNWAIEIARLPRHEILKKINQFLEKAPTQNKKEEIIKKAEEIIEELMISIKSLEEQNEKLEKENKLINAENFYLMSNITQEVDRRIQSAKELIGERYKYSSERYRK